MKAPYVIYADFEALVKKIPGCERDPDKKYKSYTEKTEWHEACGYSYIVVKSDGEVTGSKVYRGENAVKSFLESIMQEEEKIRESLAVPKPVIMSQKNWDDFKSEKNCHICEKSLVKDNFSGLISSFHNRHRNKEKQIPGSMAQKLFFQSTKEAQGRNEGGANDGRK